MTDTVATTATRNHSMDLYRVCALLLVVIGHWVTAALSFSDGAFWRENPLVEMPWTQWLTWIFQVVPVFFVVAGYASAVSWTQRSADESRQAWLRRRLVRPLGPTAVYVTFALLVVAVLGRVGVAGSELDFGAWAVAMHLWFLGIYVLVVALTPVAVAAHRRWGLWVPVVTTAVVVLVDVATIGAHLPYVGWLNHLLVWAVLYQLGIAWHDGMVRGRVAIALAACSAIVLLLLVTVGPYPVSMIGVPGAVVNNTGPPNLALLALGGVQAGLALAAAPAVNRALESRRAQRILAIANDNVMALYLWHMVPVVIVALAGYPTGLLPQPTVGTSAWWWFRLEWVAILAVVAAVELALLWWGRGLFSAPLPTMTVGIPPLLGEVLLFAGTVAIAVTISVFASLGFAPDGRFPTATSVGFAVGVALVALTPSRSLRTSIQN
ncbi:acyltransferase family protein [Mycobacterium sp. CVI_P3]|uniref:Acyltransferase family protein n=1 Tax=Mycobacterium pinniadriaticum TaxID=2994102 RepID=A0ABT3SDG0_9MYCO|nr:acyltransferase family protein [Mycobacterium pinniadriaticum]MCX2930740.1 acyltransferase family protein [Mycobacterium pinniadriaticum]MCX2937164.1 acyltransferase family protein [Mycobacterium pinniadriaticum]